MQAMVKINIVTSIPEDEIYNVIDELNSKISDLDLQPKDNEAVRDIDSAESGTSLIIEISKESDELIKYIKDRLSPIDIIVDKIKEDSIEDPVNNNKMNKFQVFDTTKRHSVVFTGSAKECEDFVRDNKVKFPNNSGIPGTDTSLVIVPAPEDGKEYFDESMTDKQVKEVMKAFEFAKEVGGCPIKTALKMVSGVAESQVKQLAKQEGYLKSDPESHDDKDKKEPEEGVKESSEVKTFDDVVKKVDELVNEAKEAIKNSSEVLKKASELVETKEASPEPHEEKRDDQEKKEDPEKKEEDPETHDVLNFDSLLFGDVDDSKTSPETHDVLNFDSLLFDDLEDDKDPEKVEDTEKEDPETHDDNKKDPEKVEDTEKKDPEKVEDTEKKDPEKVDEKVDNEEKDPEDHDDKEKEVIEEAKEVAEKTEKVAEKVEDTEKKDPENHDEDPDHTPATDEEKSSLETFSGPAFLRRVNEERNKILKDSFIRK